MIRSRSSASLILILMLCRFINAAPTTVPATAPAADDQQMESWWDDLQKPEPWSCRALLDFSSKPDQTVAFFKTHLPPLKIEQKDLDDALAALANEDEKIWKPAFEKLQYLDPRLNQMLDWRRFCRGMNRII
jgi:hypothetical protein